jgi:hypothetical protein
MSNVVKFPYSVSRRAHARKPRASKNGTPEERGTLREMVDEEIDAQMNTKIVGGIDYVLDNRPPTGSLSTTARNGRLRKKRYDVWRTAEAVTRYWRTRLDFHDAISSVQRRGLSEGRSHPDVDDGDRQPMVEKWRAAFVKQLLTPASDAASVAWKQNALARGKYEYTGLKPDRLKHAISEDLAFLAAHPVRQSNPKSAKDKA